MEQIIPLNDTVITHLQAIRGDREYLFEFGKRVDRYFYTYLHKLQDQCGIPRAEHFGLHTLRRTCATAMWECNPQAAQFALGHTSMETTASYYVRAQGMLARAVEQMPQPSAFGGKGGAV
jgi:integrase